jgi:hypothetical protein
MQTVEELVEELVNDPRYKHLVRTSRCMQPFFRCSFNPGYGAKTKHGMAHFCSVCCREFNASKRTQDAVDRGMYLIDESHRTLVNYLNYLTTELKTTELHDTELLPAHIITEHIFSFLDSKSLLQMRGVSSDWQEYINTAQTTHNLQTFESITVKKQNASRDDYDYSYSLEVELVLVPLDDIKYTLYQELVDTRGKMQKLSLEQLKKKLVEVAEIDSHADLESGSLRAYLDLIKNVVAVQPHAILFGSSSSSQLSGTVNERYYVGRLGEKILVLKLQKDWSESYY